MSKPALWFRVAAVLLLLFTAGHTYGFLAFRPSSPEGRAVWAAMTGVRFTEGHATFSYGDFYTGFGLTISIFQLFLAALSWLLGSMATRNPRDTRTIALGLFALQFAGFVLSWRYFSIAPAALSAITAICFLAGAASLRRSRPSLP